MASQDAIIQAVAAKALEQALTIERALDEAIDGMDQLGKDDIDALRRRRIQELKQRAAKEAEWRRKGHGSYQEVTDQKQWFEECKTSERVVCHFYRPSTWRCEIVDKHLSALAAKYIGTRFIKINAEKAPFLCDRLDVTVLPTILCLKDNKEHDKLVGFDELGGRDDFATSVLEARLGKSDMIDYEPPAKAPSASLKTYNASNPTGSAIYASRRQVLLDDLSDDDFASEDDTDGKSDDTTTS